MRKKREAKGKREISAELKIKRKEKIERKNEVEVILQTENITTIEKTTIVMSANMRSLTTAIKDKVKKDMIILTMMIPAEIIDTAVEKGALMTRVTEINP